MNRKDFLNTNNRLPSPVSGGDGESAGYDGNVTNWRLTTTGSMRTGDTYTSNYQKAVKYQ